MKNLIILHLESITRQRLVSFASSFPNTRRLMRDATVFDNYFSSATSTLMVVTYLFYGNDFEFDAEPEFEGMRPAENNPHLFSVLQRHGYHANLICLNAFYPANPTKLDSWTDDLPPVWSTNDFPTLLDRFDKLTDEAPFALYVWDLITHIEHSLALASIADGLTDQIRRACKMADDAIGVMLAMLEKKGLLENTTIVLYGDHGDDYWTHGFKGGMVHATEPYTQITWAPLAISDPGLAPGISQTLASTIDIAPTCLALLGIEANSGFRYAGTNLFAKPQDFVFSQNFTASQPDSRKWGIARSFSITDDTYNLVVSSRGLELYAYHLDPGNHCNLLYFFNLLPDGKLELRDYPDAAGHFQMALTKNPRALANIGARFRILRANLEKRILAKHEYIQEHGARPVSLLDPGCLNLIAEGSRKAFFGTSESPSPARTQSPALASWMNLR